MSFRSTQPLAACALMFLLTGWAGAQAAAEILVGPESAVAYLANGGPPGLGAEWTSDSFDDGTWSGGQFGLGFETTTAGAADLIRTPVPPGTVSVYARSRFELPEGTVENLHLGLDFDDGVVAWINGIEVYRSPQMPAGSLDWNTPPVEHESSNDSLPHFVPLMDISEVGLSALHPGENVLALGVWNTAATSSDLVLVPRLSINESLALLRTPYLQNAAETEVTLCWRTNLATTSRVTYGTAPDDLNLSVDRATPRSEHFVRLTNLAPGTLYYYTVGDHSQVLAGGDEQHSFVTPPLSGTAKPTRIWVLGDSGTGNDDARAVRDAYYAESQDRRTDLVLMLGDNAYPDGTDANYQSALFEIFGDMLQKSVLWPALGNHELLRADAETQTGAYFDIFELPREPHPGGGGSGTEAYYSFDHANVHFVVLDSNNSDRTTEGAMLTWLAADLAANTREWLIAYWHHSPYSHGSHDSDNEIELIEMRANAVPLLEDHGVDLILTGHSHSYERSYFIDGHHGDSETFDDAMKLDPGDGSVLGDGAYAKAERGPEPRSGAVFAVAGSSGKLSGGPLDHPAMVRSLSILGSMILDVDGVRLDARFLDDQGEIRDAFTLIKGCADPNQRFSSHRDAPQPSSDVYTPGLCDAGPPCTSDTGSSVSARLAGAFWRLGHGDPRTRTGVDSGSLPALEPGGPGFVHAEDGIPAYIEGGWADDGRIDGCMVDAAGPRCMAVMLADQVQGVGYFALLTDKEDEDGEFSFAQDGGDPIRLAGLTRPSIQGSSVLNSTQVRVDVSLAPITGGVYLDDSCAGDPIVGYRIYQQQTGRAAPMALDRTRDNGDPDTGWELAVGGAAPDGAPLPPGSTVQVTLTCFTAVDVALGTSLVFDSGFETPVVSVDSSRILCSNCERDDDLDGSCAQILDGPVGPDCDDGAAAVHPGGTQVCGDALNNDCDHPAWPSLSGTNERDDDGDGLSECDGDCRDDIVEAWAVPAGTGTLNFVQNSQSLVWGTPSNLGGLAVAYDALRTTDPSDFVTQAVCIAADQNLPFAVDPETPARGTTFFYLARAENACGGTLGNTSTGVERVGRSCP